MLSWRNVNKFLVLCVVVLLAAGCSGLGSKPKPVPEVTLPSDIDGLQLWLRSDTGVETEADDTKVVRWLDQSGKGNHAVADEGPAPVFVSNTLGYPSVSFEGGTYLIIAHDDGLNAGSEMTVIAVYRHLQGARMMQKKNNSGGNADDAWYLVPGQGLGVAGKGKSGTPSLFPASEDEIYLVSNVFDANVGTIEIYKNGKAVHSVENVPSQLPNEDPVYLGKRNNPGNESVWKGNLFELIIYDRALTDAERGEVEAYLRNKYLN